MRFQGKQRNIYTFCFSLPRAQLPCSLSRPIPCRIQEDLNIKPSNAFWLSQDLSPSMQISFPLGVAILTGVVMAAFSGAAEVAELQKCAKTAQFGQTFNLVGGEFFSDGWTVVTALAAARRNLFVSSGSTSSHCKKIKMKELASFCFSGQSCFSIRKLRFFLFSKAKFHFWTTHSFVRALVEGIVAFMEHNFFLKKHYLSKWETKIFLPLSYLTQSPPSQSNPILAWPIPL